MAKLLPAEGLFVRTALGLAVAASLLLLPPDAGGQSVLPHGLFASKKKQAAPQPPPVRATVQPSSAIAIEPLGFSAPAPFYLTTRNALVSLDFLDEDRLLFTFRVPGLIHRAQRTEETENERKVRAVVLRVPQGNVEAESVWTLHDRSRYLYNLGGGTFLLRDGDSLKVGDASLQLKPFLQFPGPLEWVEVDPSRQYLVTGSSEPPTEASGPGNVTSPMTARADVAADHSKPPERPDLVLRILRREDGKVMLVSHVPSAVQLPINGEGYLETLRGNGTTWMLNFNYFSGGSTNVGSIESACAPTFDFLSATEFLATTCTSGDIKLVAMGLNGRRLWENSSLPSVWPVLARSANSPRFARESLMATQIISPVAPLQAEDVKGQDVQIIDAATGRLALRAAASPPFDVGGNVAVSPSGRRVAILMDGAIQIFELPAPPPLPNLGIKH